MENYEMSMFMDVKLDIPDKRAETVKFKSWTKCLVKFEAIKCFPSFLRVTFIKNVEEEAANLSVSINVPGLSISLAYSRTKQHSYALFWTRSRKRCFVYCAVESETSCRRHMKWIKKSIKTLELHRQVILEARRSSRGRLELNTKVQTQAIDNGSSPHCSNSKRNLQDILGPLPKIPDAERSRRVSSVSGIYEEITDNVNDGQRISTASGIYEEMKLSTAHAEYNSIIEESYYELPPPVPPRKRINTFEKENQVLMRIPRSKTNPEADLAKKKKYKSMIEHLFKRAPRSVSVSEGKVSNAEDLIRGDEKDYVNAPIKISECELKANANNSAKNSTEPSEKSISNPHNKRNSFSSPDVSNAYCFEDFETLDNFKSLSSEFIYSEDINFSQQQKIKINDETESRLSLNISAQIQPNFNISCNSSTINLVGANLITETHTLLEDISGYCRMAPIKKTESKVDGISSSSSVSISPSPHNNDSDKENEGRHNSIDLANESQIYENMVLDEVPINRCLELDTSSDAKFYQNPVVKEMEKESYYQTPRRIVVSVDDKVPSYYPNNCDFVKLRRYSRSPSFNNAPTTTTQCSHDEKTNQQQLFQKFQNSANFKIARRENLYISSPQKNLDDERLQTSSTISMNNSYRKKIGGTSPLMARKISANVYTVMHSSTNETDRNSSPATIKPTTPSSDRQIATLTALQNIEFKFDDTATNQSDLINNDNNVSKIYQKYASLTRITTSSNQSQKQQNDCKTNFFEQLNISPRVGNNNNNNHHHHQAKIAASKSMGTHFGDLTGVKKFTSLPRFKKIDFSPLRLKINNVLQRHVHNNEV